MHSRKGDRGINTANLILNRMLLHFLIKRLMESNLFVSPFRIFNTVKRKSKTIEGEELWITDSSFISKSPKLMRLVRPVSVIRMGLYGLFNNLQLRDLLLEQISILLSYTYWQEFLIPLNASLVKTINGEVEPLCARTL